jgi:hypothetical protein
MSISTSCGIFRKYFPSKSIALASDLYSRYFCQFWPCRSRPIAARCITHSLRYLPRPVRRSVLSVALATVALSGRVFQNEFLLTRTACKLENQGFRVFTHRQVPSNDGGISLGQGRGGLCRPSPIGLFGWQDSNARPTIFRQVYRTGPSADRRCSARFPCADKRSESARRGFPNIYAACRVR